jgi:small conductance mechanosensitive channel
MDKLLDETVQDMQQFFREQNTTHSLLVLAVSLFVAYWASRLIARLIVMAAQAVAVRADRTDNDERAVQLRRVETYLSVLTAVVKVVTVVALVYIGWTWLMPTGSTKVAAIGAGTVFVVLAGATIGPVLRDITAGSIMIIERWFNVGDYIRVEPFAELGGVVEQVTLRSTKIRSLNGEVIWVHNQYIQGVRMTPRGIRTIHIDIIVRNLHVGRELVERVTSTLPTGTMTLLQKPTIVREEQWAKERWFLTIEGKTPPGREWLMENYFVESLKELDEESAKPALTRIPIVRYADPAAERSFKRAVRTANSANK